MSSSIYSNIILFLVAMLGVANVIMSAVHGDDITCNTNDVIDLSLKQWMLIFGIVIIIASFFTLVTTNCDVKNVEFIYALLLLFLFVWSIVGSIAFWHDCMNTDPINVRRFMWVQLIMIFLIYVIIFLIIIYNW